VVFIYLDENGNEIQDNDEPGIPGAERFVMAATVKLSTVSNEGELGQYGETDTNFV
jgi:hypothetical protein